MARFVFLASLSFLVSSAAAQVADTTYLREVRVYGLPVTTYSTGSKIEQIKTGEEVVTLSDKLINETSFYLKTYGNNQLSTIAIRGTTASQTAVLWNGMNINSPTLGQTDFSLIPLFLFDEVSLRYGTASSLYGSDAIGGSILIGQRAAKFAKGFSGTFYQQVGSFGKFNTGIKAEYGNERWDFRTKLYHSFLENDFPYESPAVGYSKTQNHASVTNYGFDQQVHFKISETQQLSAEGMYTYNFREIQPAVTNDQANETLRDRHVRLSLNYQNDSRIGVLSATAGYIFSNQEYADDNVSTVLSKQLTTLVSVDKSINVKSNLRYGVSFSNYSGSSENYASTVSENRYDGFVSLGYALHPFWLVNLNIRQSFYDNHYSPFAPTVGTEVHVLHADKNKLVFRAQAARGFRVPTLNDRYWVPGGNPGVTPEDAFHIEGGANWTRTINSWTYTMDGSLYQSWVDDMIVWLPEENVWSPTNLQQVDIHGLEVNAKAALTQGKYQYKLNLIYSYCRSVNKEGQNDLHKQLAYVPIHSGRASATMLWNRLEFNMRLNVTSIRYTTLDNERSQALDPYALLDASLTKQFRIQRVSLQLQAEAFNLFNIYYENLKNHAMPGRHYAISISVNFNNNKQTP